MSSEHQASSHHIASVKAYVGIFLALLAGTALTVAAAFIDMGKGNTPVALVIAFTKMMLVVMFFMHVKYAPKLTKLAAAAGFFWLVIMIALTCSDIFTRNWDMNPDSWEASSAPAGER